MQITLNSGVAARIKAYTNETRETPEEAVNTMLAAYFREHPDVVNPHEEAKKFHLNKLAQRTADARAAGATVIKGGQNLRG